ncbi:hypothetical protein [Pseudomonas putida]|uniref:hypothetical protein n=1 Tax=Pseudomonas putida TaxID=303 RepID=UPI0008592C54|nr:hypothetical protein [Pseudomonas putida]
MISKAENRAIDSVGGGATFIKPKPVIEGLTQSLEVDLDRLGSDSLSAVIRGAGLSHGDLVYSNWLGVDPEGVPFDLVREVTLVQDPDNVVLQIDNRTVTNASGGYAFLSYQVNDVTAPESMRQFCYVGVRGPGRLPVVQVLQSHGLKINKDELQQHAHVVTAAYQAIQDGDQVTLTVRRFRSTGLELSKLEKSLRPEQKFNGEPLEWLIPKSDLNAVDVDGRLEMSYTVKLKDGRELAPSRTQTFLISDAVDTGTLLPAPEVGNGGGSEIDPGNYPDGLPIIIDGYPQPAVGDYLLLAWVLPSGEASVQVIRLDASSLVAGRFSLLIEPALLLASLGAVQVFYQYAREGASLTSHAVPLDVTAPRAVPPMPTVRDSTNAGAADEYNINAWDIRRNGAYVLIPSEADLRPDEHVEVHWQGDPNGGRTIIQYPDAEGPLVFNVPAEFVPANMGVTPSKRFDVFYRIVETNTGLHWDSKAVKLLVLPVDETRYERIDCPDANADEELVLVPAGGRLKLEPWLFIKKDQLLSIHLSGIGAGSVPVTEVLRDQVPVTELQVKEGVDDLLTHELLSKLQPDQKFLVWASVSFDGVQRTDFPKLDLTLKV